MRSLEIGITNCSYKNVFVFLQACWLYCYSTAHFEVFNTLH